MKEPKSGKLPNRNRGGYCIVFKITSNIIANGTVKANESVTRREDVKKHPLRENRVLNAHQMHALSMLP